MVTIAISNWKGGSFKTTTTANLGAYFAKEGYKVLLVDMDPQFNLSQSFQIVETDEQEIETIYEALINKKKMPVYNIAENLDLAPSGFDMIGVERALGEVIHKSEDRLKRALKELDYDLVLIDCPPSISRLTVNAFSASNYIIAPVQPETLSFKGLIHLEQRLNEYEYEIDFIFLGRFNERKNLNAMVYSQLKERFNKRLLNTKIRECIQVAEAPLVGKSVLDYAPGSNGADDYIQLGEEILNRIKE